MSTTEMGHWAPPQLGDVAGHTSVLSSVLSSAPRPDVLIRAARSLVWVARPRRRANIVSSDQFIHTVGTPTVGPVSLTVPQRHLVGTIAG